jgi:hypothetical protein
MSSQNETSSGEKQYMNTSTYKMMTFCQKADSEAHSDHWKSQKRRGSTACFREASKSNTSSESSSQEEDIYRFKTIKERDLTMPFCNCAKCQIVTQLEMRKNVVKY